MINSLIGISTIIFLWGTVGLAVMCFYNWLIRTKRIQPKKKYSATLWVVSGKASIILGAFFLETISNYDSDTLRIEIASLLFQKWILVLYLFYMLLIVYMIKSNPPLNTQITTEVVFFFSASVLGLLALIIYGNSFIKAYICIELISICSVLLSHKTQGGSKVSLMYYIMSAIGSGFLLFGISLMYYIIGGETLLEISRFFKTEVQHLDTWDVSLLRAGYILFFCGFFIKIGAVVPFHLWIGAVYGGTYSYLVTYFSSIPMLGLFGFLVNLNLAIGTEFISSIGPFFNLVSLLSVVIGTFGAMQQDRLKRIFAYSSISNIGFILALVPFANWETSGTIIFFIVIYSITAFCFWGIISILEFGYRIQINNIKDLKQLYNSSREHKLVAVCLMIFLFSSMGIPPLAGFFGKYMLFMGLLKHEAYVFLFLFIILSCLSAFYSLRLVITIVTPSKEIKHFYSHGIVRSLLLGIVMFSFFHLFFFLFFGLFWIKSSHAALCMYIYIISNGGL